MSEEEGRESHKQTEGGLEHAAQRRRGVDVRSRSRRCPLAMEEAILARRCGG